MSSVLSFRSFSSPARLVSPVPLRFRVVRVGSFLQPGRMTPQAADPPRGDPSSRPRALRRPGDPGHSPPGPLGWPVMLAPTSLSPMIEQRHRSPLRLEVCGDVSMGHRRRGVPQERLDRLQVNPALRQPTSERDPEVVKPQCRHPDRLARLPPPPT